MSDFTATQPPHESSMGDYIALLKPSLSFSCHLFQFIHSAALLVFCASLLVRVHQVR